MDASQYLKPEGHSLNDPTQRDADGGDHIVSETVRRISPGRWWIQQGLKKWKRDERGKWVEE